MISEVYNEDCLTGLSKIADGSVDCVITSPPYWQLRDYGWDGQWGLEPTFQQYLEHLWQLMDEVKRVLKPEGTAWVNLGDTFNTTSGRMGSEVDQPKFTAGENGATKFKQQKDKIIPSKCLLLIPHRFAIGCIDRGWIVRNDVIWAKRNGMPESVTDRFSKKHEYFFLMVKNENYYFDLDGIRDKHTNLKDLQRRIQNGKGKYTSPNSENYGADFNKRDRTEMFNKNGKNPGSVSDFWDIPTMPSNEDHYATYNTKLIEKPIVAGCPIGGTILDPFMGTGTTGLRAMELGRNFIGIEGSKVHCDNAAKKFELFKSQGKLEFI
jgi:DNA modification methylase